MRYYVVVFRCHFDAIYGAIPGGQNPANLLSLSGNNSGQGKGSVEREEVIETQVAAIVTQKLPNGNVLITESSGGRLFEVTPDKRIVWEYINPVRVGEKDRYIPWLIGGARYATDELPFLHVTN